MVSQVGLMACKFWPSSNSCPFCSSALNPAAAVSSGDTIVVETATQHAGDDYDKVLISSCQLTGKCPMHPWARERHALEGIWKFTLLTRRLHPYPPCLASLI